MWFIFALLSAVFAALTSILAKVGIEGVNSNLATAIRTVVVVVMAWGMVFLTNTQGTIADISKRSWLFLILSGLATGASWLCYYKALQLGEASKVVPIDKLSVVITLILAFVFLHEQFLNHSIDLAPAIELSSNDLLVDLASIGLGIAFVPDYCINEHTPDNLYALKIKDHIPSRKLVAAYDSSLPLTEPARFFLELLQDSKQN